MWKRARFLGRLGVTIATTRPLMMQKATAVYVTGRFVLAKANNVLAPRMITTSKLLSPDIIGINCVNMPFVLALILFYICKPF